MVEFLKSHWYWVLGGVVGTYIGYKLFFGGSSSNASAAAPAATVQAVSSDPNSDALQAQNIQAQSNIALAQTAANAQVNLAQIMQAQDAVDQAANTQNTQINDQYTLAITNSNNTLGALQSTNGKEVSLASIAAALGLGTTQANDALQLGITQANVAGSVASQQIASALALGLNTNQTNLNELVDNNATQLAAYGIQANVINNANNDQTQLGLASVGAAQSIDLASISAAQQIANAQIAGNVAIQQGVVAGINAGVYNKGGQGGSNQILALSAINGAPAQAASGAAITGVAANSNNSISSIIGSIGTTIGTAAAGLKLLGA